MEIVVADQRVLLFDNQLTPQGAESKAWEKKIVAFDTISKVGSFLSHPKDDDFELIYHEHRYQPFCHIIAQARYIYDRNTEYKVETSGSEVQSVTCMSKQYESTGGYINLSVTEHCVQEEKEEVFVDAVTGKNQPELVSYLSFSHKQVIKELKEMVHKDSILVPPQMRVSAIMRNTLSKMIKGIQADKIQEETIDVSTVELYYRPIYAFQYRWKSKGKEGIVEIDALTGTVKGGNRVFREYLGKVLDKDFLFDLGADAAGLLFPGGSIVIKAAKKYIDSRKTSKK
ncbi:MAG: hypothetical protein M1365_12790 [Actinobacteria bacterium]|nr:hypothetical protein [Actinomycetota bacterium]